MSKVETKIEKPSGQPFQVVGTGYAHSVITGLVKAVGEALADEEERDDVLDDGRLLRGLVEHRDHLHAQVGELQATLTLFQLAERYAIAKVAGMQARMTGVLRTDCPILFDGDPVRKEWQDGWDEADRFADRVIATVREVDKYAPKKP
jgi:ribosome modulation factor